jgi:phage gpG-like protein
MATTFRVQIHDEELKRVLQELPGVVLERALKPALHEATITMRDEIADALSGRVLRTRSSTYKSSIRQSVATEGPLLKGTVLTDVVYAPLHEHGGVISAPGKGPLSKARSWLTIPLPGGSTGAGVRRFDAPTAIKQGAFFPKGRHILAMQAGGRLVPLFALKKSVRIPARPIWGPTLERMTRTLPDIVNRWLTKALASLGERA